MKLKRDPNFENEMYVLPIDMISGARMQYLAGIGRTGQANPQRFTPKPLSWAGDVDVAFVKIPQRLDKLPIVMDALAPVFIDYVQRYDENDDTDEEEHEK